MKNKKCRICKSIFEPIRPLAIVCSYDCSIAYAKVLADKNKASTALKMRRETKVKLDKLKTRLQWLKETQIVFNKYIRLRDAALPCISCQRFHAGQYHAGHYKTVGSAPQLRFNEDNCHKQCAPCNNHLSGNIINYRINLILKVGRQRVELLESINTIKKYTIDDIKELKLFYKAKIKEITNEKSTKTNHA